MDDPEEEEWAKHLEVIIVDTEQIEGMLFSEWVKSFSALYGRLSTTEQQRIWNLGSDKYLALCALSDPLQDNPDAEYILEAITEPAVGEMEGRIWLFRSTMPKKKRGRPRKEKE